MSERQIRLDEVGQFEKFLASHGVSNTTLTGYARDRRRAIEIDYPEEAASVAGEQGEGAPAQQGEEPEPGKGETLASA